MIKWEAGRSCQVEKESNLMLPGYIFTENQYNQILQIIEHGKSNSKEDESLRSLQISNNKTIIIKNE